LRALPIDILQEIDSKFESESKSASKLIAQYREAYDYLDVDRIIRCVIHLSNSSLQSLKSNLENAKTDPRDVMLWAEYENTNALHPSRVRDFNKTFSENRK